METKFNSQICTTREQSERLLALGLKKETADMYYDNKLEGELPRLMPHTSEIDYFQLWDRITPAWSLHRMIELIPESVTQEIPYFTKDGNVELVNSDGIITKAFGGENLYDALLDFFRWLIKEGYFNKEYLV